MKIIVIMSVFDCWPAIWKWRRNDNGGNNEERKES